MAGGGGCGLEGLVHFGGAGPEDGVLELGVQVPVQQDAEHAVGGGPGHHEAAELRVIGRLVPQRLKRSHHHCGQSSLQDAKGAYGGTVL